MLLKSGQMTISFQKPELEKLLNVTPFVPASPKGNSDKGDEKYASSNAVQSSSVSTLVGPVATFQLSDGTTIHTVSQTQHAPRS